MSILFRLLIANVRLRPGRTILTAMAVLASSCVVVWVVSGYDALLAQSVDERAAEALGRFDVVFAAGGGFPGAPGAVAKKKGGRRGGAGSPGAPSAPPGFSEDLLTALKADPRVREANRITTAPSMAGKAEQTAEEASERTLIRGDRPPVHGAPPISPTLNGTDALEAPYEMVSGRWLSPDSTERSEAVLSADAAERLEVQVGQEIAVHTEAGEVRLAVVGIVERASSAGAGRFGGSPVTQSGIFVTIPTASKIAGYAPRPSRIFVTLREGADASAFREDWSKKLEIAGTPGRVTDLPSLKDSLAQGMTSSGNLALAYSATGMSLMAALFIIFTALSMGVTERSRELAVLRAVGMTRSQVAGLVVLEGLLLAVLGWLGGLAAGWALLRIAAAARPELFTEGAALGFWGVTLTAIAAGGGALAASIVPAWRATRVQPIDAMAPPRTAPPSRWVGPTAAAVLALLAVNPLLTYVLPLSDANRTWGYALIGYPGMLIGVALLAPLAVLGVERFAGPIVARLLALPPQLLSSLLSAQLWRTLGTTVTLTVGLGLYLATQIWGYSMLAPYLPGDWMPEMLVGFEPSGLPDDQVEAVRRVPRIQADRLLPMAVEQPGFAESVTAGKSRSSSLYASENVVLIGVDPDQAFGGSHPILDITFLGDRSTALSKLKAGKACLVPDHLATMWKLKPGDTLELVPPNATGTTVGYEIAGVVSLPGWPWMTKMSGLRRQTTRTGGLVFAPFADVRRDFRLTGVNFFWFDTDGKASPAEVEASLQAIAEAHGASTFRVEGVGEVHSRQPYARLTASQTVLEGVQQRADGIIWGMSQLPLTTLFITSLAVLNTVLASVRSRRWEMGILRALGITRWGLVRLVLAEAILIGISVCLLGLSFALVAGWCGTGMARYLSPFGGLETPLILPWAKTAMGFVLALGLCLLAAIWPAIATGRTEPLRLLQTGRAAA